MRKLKNSHTQKQKIPKNNTRRITHPFAEAENKTFLLFVNVKQEKYDSFSKQVKIIRFSDFNISCFP
jgi:hypothetical protein